MVELTQAEIAEKFKSDPKLLIGFVVQNNPLGVYANMRKAGIITSKDPNEMFTKLLEFGSRKPKCAAKILNVPLRYSVDQVHLVEGIQEAGIFEPKKMRSSLSTKTSDLDQTNADYFDDWVPLPTNPEDFASDETEVSGSWNWNWLGDAFGAIGSAFNFLSGGSNQTPANTSANSGNKTGMIVIGSIVLLAVAVGIYFILKK